MVNIMSKEEWNESAKIIVDDSLAIKQEEKVLIVIGDSICDDEGLTSLYQALRDELVSRNIETTTISYNAVLGVEPPYLVEMACTQADVIITICARGFLHSSTFPRINGNRKRYSRMLMLPNGNNFDFLNRMMPKTKERFYDIVDVSGSVCKYFLPGHHEVHLTAQNGTDLTFSIGSLIGYNQDGVCTTPGTNNFMPGGSLNVGVDEGSANGTLVIDCYTALKPTLLENPIIFKVADGAGYEVCGGSEARDFLAAATQASSDLSQSLCIAEFGIGFDKVADINVNPSEGEHIYGGAHIGIGANVSFCGSVDLGPWHKDCIIEKATVEVDGKLILKDGEYLV